MRLTLFTVMIDGPAVDARSPKCSAKCSITIHFRHGCCTRATNFSAWCGVPTESDRVHLIGQ